MKGFAAAGDGISNGGAAALSVTIPGLVQMQTDGLGAAANGIQVLG